MAARRFLRSLGTFAAGLYATVSLLALLGTDRLLFQPHPSSYAAADPARIWLRTAAGARLAAIYLDNPAADRVLLVSHGNAEDLGDLRPTLERLRTLGFSVLAYDYEGYGESEGKPSERALYADVDAAYAWLTRERGVAPARIIAYGRSLGGGPSVDLASREPLAGLALENTFTSVYRVVLPAAIFPGDRFDNLGKMSRVRCPVLVMHGRRDRVIPFRHGEALFAAAPGWKRALWVDDADHAEIPWRGGDRWAAALRELARQ